MINGLVKSSFCSLLMLVNTTSASITASCGYEGLTTLLIWMQQSVKGLLQIMFKRDVDSFCRYGKIQSVKLQPAKDNETTLTATVAFMDIRSASKAHTSKHTLENAVLRTDYWDATSSTPSRSQGNGGGGGNVGGGSSGGGAATPASTTTSNSSSTGFHHGTATASSVNRTASGGTNNAGAFSSSWTATG